MAIFEKNRPISEVPVPDLSKKREHPKEFRDSIIPDIGWSGNLGTNDNSWLQGRRPICATGFTHLDVTFTRISTPVDERSDGKCKDNDLDGSVKKQRQRLSKAMQRTTHKSLS